MNRRKNIFCPVFLILALGVFSVSCDSQEAKTYSDISKAELTAMMNEAEFILVDVRTNEEVAEGMIDGALHIDISADDFEERMKALNREKTIVIYCKSGGRSSRAASRMAEWGFTNVYNLEDGYMGWSK